MEGLRKLNLADMCMRFYECGQPRILRQEGHADFTVPATLELASLRELDFGGTLPGMVYNVSSMPQLQRLRVPTSYLKETHISQLGVLSQLQSLELDNCTVDHISDLTSIATGLRVLRLHCVDVRQPPSADEKAELVQQLTNLTTIRLAYERILHSYSASVVSTMTKLIAIEHPLRHDFHDLATLVNLEHLDICIEDSRRHDFGALRLLRKLVKVTLTPAHEEWYNETIEAANAAAVIAELAHLPMLEHFGCLRAYTFPLTGLSRIKSCNLTCDSRNHGWLGTFETLRILEIEIGSHEPFSLASLSQLEALTVTVARYTIPIPSAIVAPLVNLRSLAIEGTFDDWSVLRPLTKLTNLTIYSPNTSPNYGLATRFQDADELRGLVCLRHLDLRKTDLFDVFPLLGLRELRTLAIPEDVDCTPLVESEALSKLVRVLHPHHNCLWSCSHRARRAERQNERRREAVEPRE